MIHSVLQQEQAQTALLRDLVEEKRRVESSTQSQSNFTPTPIGYYAPEYPSPEGRINGLIEGFRPQFENLFGAQRELGVKVDGLGYVGQMALQESMAHTGLLENLDNSARTAFHQRNAELDKLGQSLMSQRVANIQLAGIGNQVETMNGNIIKTASDFNKSTRLSSAIISGNISELKESLVAALGDISFDIGDLSNEVANTRLEVIEELQNSQAIFLWSHREQMWVRKQILDVLQKPRQTAAREAWQIGEKCRLAGHINEAVRMYRESIHIDPSEARNYISLGIINLNNGNVDTAKQFFMYGASYATDSSLKGNAIMYLSKIEMFEKDYPHAKETLEKALYIDITNFEIWFDLAICEMKMGNKEKALYYVKNLLYAPLHVPRNRMNEAAQYAIKIIAESSFTPIMEDIRKIMREIINNQIK